MSQFGKPEYKSISKLLGYTLTVGETWAWWAFSHFLFTRLTRAERAALAYYALLSLDEQDGFKVAEKALFFTERPAP